MAVSVPAPLPPVVAPVYCPPTGYSGYALVGCILLSFLRGAGTTLLLLAMCGSRLQIAAAGVVGAVAGASVTKGISEKPARETSTQEHRVAIKRRSRFDDM